MDREVVRVNNGLEQYGVSIDSVGTHVKLCLRSNVHAKQQPAVLAASGGAPVPKVVAGLEVRLGLCMASTNAFTSCKALKLCAAGETMHSWQWRLMRYVFLTRKIAVQAKHLPIRANRGTCVCYQGGASTYKCQACGVSLHVDCFAEYHQ